MEEATTLGPLSNGRALLQLLDRVEGGFLSLSNVPLNAPGHGGRCEHRPNLGPSDAGSYR